VDTDGRLLKAYVHPADWTDAEGSAPLLAHALPDLPSLKHLWADGAYVETRDWLRWHTHKSVCLQLVANPSPHAFAVASRRWVVERTFAWLGRSRRLAKDFERLTSSSTFFIYFCSAKRLLSQLSFS
jgi:putative transposase